MAHTSWRAAYMGTRIAHTDWYVAHTNWRVAYIGTRIANTGWRAAHTSRHTAALPLTRTINLPRSQRFLLFYLFTFLLFTISYN